MRKEINHFNQICKRKKSINTNLKTKKKMKAKTDQFRQGKKTTGEINITIEIEKKIRKRKPLDG